MAAAAGGWPAPRNAGGAEWARSNAALGTALAASRLRLRPLVHRLLARRCGGVQEVLRLARLRRRRALAWRRRRLRAGAPLSGLPPSAWVAAVLRRATGRPRASPSGWGAAAPRLGVVPAGALLGPATGWHPDGAAADGGPTALAAAAAGFVVLAPPCAAAA